MSNCPDLCTAAKCQELEARIGALEQALALLEASFEAHTQQEIPEAHAYIPQVKLNLAIEDNNLLADVTVDGETDFSEVPLPKFEPLVTFDIFPIGNNSYEFQVSVDGETDSDTLTLDDFLDLTVGLTSNDEIEVSVQFGDRFATDSTSLPNSNVSVDFFNVDENGALLKVQVGNDSDEDYISFPQIEQTEHRESNLKINGSYQSDILTITVADGESQDTFQVTIDNNFSGGGAVNNDCCGAILSALANLSNEIQQVYNEVTIDVTGTTNTDYECNSETLDPEFTLTTYSGQGIKGIHENLKIINTNLDSIFKTTCVEAEAIDVVSIVASDGVISRATGKKLVLHFVEPSNYPKRTKGSSYWQVQIPAPKDNYNWEEDFKDLRFERGNQFAELRFNEFNTPVKGYFASETAANKYFDDVLDLTNATEKNRVYPKHKTPQILVTNRITRPYRAFINSVNSDGRAICHVKFVPPTDE